MNAVRFALWATLLALAAPVLAQSVPTPPVRTYIDGNGVDLTTGSFNYSKTDVSIGPVSGPGGLAYTRTYNSGYGWTDNWVMAITNPGLGSQFFVTLGGVSDEFTKSGSTYTSTLGAGSTLVYQTISGAAGYTYQSAEGTLVRFEYNTAVCVSGLACARVSYIVKPNGERINFTYQKQSYCTNFASSCTIGYRATIVRLSSINNNQGYQLKFAHAFDGTVTNNTEVDDWQMMNGVTGINNAVEYCDPAADTCSLTGSWPTATYAIANGPGTVTRTVTDPSGQNWVYYSTTSSLSIRPPSWPNGGVTVAFSGGKVSSVTNALSNAWSYGYAGTLTTTMTDPLGHTRVVTSTSPGQPLTDTNGLGKVTTNTYDSYGRLATSTAPESNYVTYTYDGRGNVTQTVATDKSHTATLTTSAAYDTTCSNVLTCNQPNSTTDANGNTTNYTYDSGHGGLLTVEAPAPTTGAARPKTTLTYGSVTAYVKNAGGSIVAASTSITVPLTSSSCLSGSSCSGTSAEAVREIGYGSSGVANNRLPLTVTSRDGSSTLVSTVTTTYSTLGDVYQVQGPLGIGDVTTWLHDLERRTIGVIAADPDGSGPMNRTAQRISYDGDGRVTTSELGTVASSGVWSTFTAAQTTTTTYDAAGQAKRSTLASGATTYAVSEYSYDAANRPACAAVRMNDSVFGTPLAACTQVSTPGSYGPDRITKTATYDNANRPLTVIEAYGTAQARTTTTSYTDNGLQATLTDANSNRTTYEYDGFDRLAKLRYPEKATPNTSSMTDYEQRTYDANSNVTNLRTRSNDTIGLTYDNLNRLTVKDLPGGTAEDVYLAYDNLGHLTSALYASTSGSGVTQAWDALGRMTSQSTYGRTLSYQYDIAGNRTRLTWPDASWVGYTIDPLYRVSAISQAGSSLLTFGYDDLGRRTSIGRANGVTTAYTYDPVSRLDTLVSNLTGSTNDYSSALAYTPASQLRARTQANDATYAWKTSANQTVGYTPNGLNQITQVQGINLSYDANGNLTQGGATYTYDVENKLRSASAPTPVTLSYDPMGRLSQTTSTTTAQILYDGDDLVAEYDGAGTQTRRYVHGPGTDEPLVQYAGSGTGSRTWLTADERGSVTAVSDDSGNMIVSQAYSPDGQPDSWTASRFGYTGQIAIPEAALWHYKARAYAPRMARFLQTDPIGTAGGINLYAYVSGDPINGIDPYGLSEVCEPKGASHICQRKEGQPTDANARGGPTPRPDPKPYSPDSPPDGGGGGPGEILVIGKRIVSGLADLVGPLSTGSKDQRVTLNTTGVAVNVDGTTVRRYNRMINYCGPEEGPQLPNSAGGASFNEACFLHDLCYGKSGISRGQCDSDFSMNILKLVTIRGPLYSTPANAAQSIFYAFSGYALVRRFGGEHYESK